MPAIREYDAVFEYFPERTTKVAHTVERVVDTPDGDRMVVILESQPDGTHSKSMQRVIQDASGWGYNREDSHDGTTLTFDPPKYWLVVPIENGRTWSGTHPGRRGTTTVRTCVAVDDRVFCDEGIAVTCRTTSPTLEVMLRDHYCRGDGWRGQEGAVYPRDTGALGLSYGTMNLIINGDPFESPPLADRPLPLPSDVEHPLN